MDKTKKETETDANPATAQETATRPGETEEKGGQEGGTDAEGHEDPGLDQGSETPAAWGEGLLDIEEVTENISKEMYESAKKVFATRDVDRLWFTADGLGFGSGADASAHATTLKNKALLEIDRKDLD